MPYKNPAASSKAYYLKNAETIKARAKAWYDNNRERAKVRDAAYKETNKKRIRQYFAARYAANREHFKAKSLRRYKAAHPIPRPPKLPPEHRRQYLAKWRKKNRARIRAATERYYRKHGVRICRQQAESRQTNRAAWLAWSRDYRKRNQHKRNAATGQRRALKRQNTVGDPAAIEAFYEWVRSAPLILCHHCGQPVPRQKRHVDHLVPLKRGGAHALSNLVPSCETCNCRKGARLIVTSSRP
jgi:5-methylcytosine-specific restriction endonuclease McrA